MKVMANAIMVFKAEDYLKHGFDIALRENITVYDATYIALTERKKMQHSIQATRNNITLLKSM
ncbi:MAG: hypothetical protein NDF52_05530 [archaeon YNP-WB-062]|nr:hypothetical protein [Candidatus Verstraetearchaeota archaeon]MCS7367321.1 hypothetical protein [Candidatus Culexarchaeum yellowstonense]